MASHLSEILSKRETNIPGSPAGWYQPEYEACMA
jgi:hypothetical protein